MKGFTGMAKQTALLVSGDRHATLADWGQELLPVLSSISERCSAPVMIVGDAGGIDEYAALLGKALGFQVIVCYAQWPEYNPRAAAGPARNRAMVQQLKALATVGYEPKVIAFHDELFTGQSRGTKNLVEQADRAGFPIWVVSRVMGLESLKAHRERTQQHIS